jgi:hypothetical protein
MLELTLVFVVLPLLVAALVRNCLLGFALSCVLGTSVLWIAMIWNEATSEQSDFDIIFAIAMIVWAFVQICVYALIFLFLFLLRCLRQRRRANKLSRSDTASSAAEVSSQRFLQS